MLDWHDIHFNSTLLDLHAHPSFNVSLFNRAITKRFYPSRAAFDPFSVRTNIPRLQQGGVDVLMSVVYAPERGIFDECRYLRILGFFMQSLWKKIYGRPYFDVTSQMLDEMEKALANDIDPVTGKLQAKFAHSVSELDAILSQPEPRPVAFIPAIEGGHCIDGKLENLQAFFERGVAYMTLAHFFANEIVNPVFPWPEPIQKFGCFQGERDVSLGLKPFGEEVVEKMVDLGMLIDVSHCTPAARARIYEIVGNRRPILATHVGAYEINPSPYNLKDWELKKIADSGGAAGVIFMNYWLMPHETGRGVNFIARTIEHFVQKAGIDHVAIGTDFDGFTDPPDDLKDASELPILTQRLVAEMYDEDAIRKILGGNALRVLREGWGRK
ncbi:MAG: rane dipeptidase [Chloroflexi bacterium]|nr:rane dipeptidase [Chloroflexota bacterium]